MMLVHEGKTTKEIARELDLTPATVDSYIKVVMRTYGISDRHTAAVLALADFDDSSRAKSSDTLHREALVSQSGSPSPALHGPAFHPPSTAAEVREMAAPYRVMPQGLARWVPAPLRPLVRGERMHNYLSPVERGMLIFQGTVIFAIVFILLMVALVVFGWASRWMLRP